MKCKRKVATFLCLLLCFTININPIAVICGAVVDSGLVDRLSNVKDNLIYIAQNGVLNVMAEDESTSEDTANSTSGSTGGSKNNPLMPNISFTCDASSAISTIMGDDKITLTGLNSKANEIKGAINDSSTKVKEVISSASGNIVGAVNSNKETITTLNNNVTLQFNTINGKMDTIKEDVHNIWSNTNDIKEKLDEINANIDSMQHNYRVAHLYSLNNAYSNSLWKPQADDIPYVKDIATVVGGFANVYTGYWDTSVSTLNNPSNLKTKRALEVLGYDVLVRSEGLVLVKDVAKVTDQNATTGLSGKNQAYKAVDDKTDATDSILMYYQEMIPEDKITWIDAVTTLYKALGQEQITYQSFMSYDSKITPETSPAYNGLSNPVPDNKGNYNGYDLYMFFTRANVISKEISKSGATEAEIDKKLSDITTAKVNYIYWEKALNGGFIPSEYLNSALSPITFSEFFKLASRMMQAYGEPVMNDDELKALLQVYGTHYPIQLGTDVADAWAYMAARGILDFSEYTEGNESILYDIMYTGYITRDQLLTMCMRIKDTDSRTDYKKIDVVLNLSDVMKEDYYYPVYNLNISNGEFTTDREYDHTASATYDYLIRKSSEMTLGDIGTPLVFSEKTTDTSKRIVDASVSSTVTTLSDGSEWYHVSVPKSYTGNFYVAMHVEGNASINGNTVTYIEVPSNCLGGGYYSKYSISGDTATVSTDSGAYLTFDKMTEYTTRNYTDYVRAKETKPTGTSTASNATLLEKLSAKIDKYTSPMIVNAAQNKINTIAYDAGSLTVKYEGIINADIGLTNTMASLQDFIQQNTNISVNSLYVADKSFFEGCTVAYTTKDDTLLLQRLATINEFGKDIGYAKYDKNTFPAGVKSAINTMLSSTKENHVPTDCAYFNALYSKNKTVSYTRGGGQFEKTKSMLPVQFITGMLANQYTFDKFTPGTTCKFNAGDTESIGTGAYGLANEEYNKLLNELLNTYYTDAQDKILNDIIAKGVTGVEYLALGKYKVTGSNAGRNALSEMLTSDELTSSSASSTSSGTIDGGLSIESSVATSTIMNRQQQILISWADMVNSGYIVTTGSTEQPTMQTNGAYYFMTKEGQVIVNPTAGTIQIGTTLYDLVDSQGNIPKLVYVDTEQENMLYFDYRCVMGIVSKMYTIDDGKTKEFQNHLSTSTAVVYDLQSSGVTADWYNTMSVRAYNYPETPNVIGTPVTSNQGYIVKLIKSTLYDGVDTDYGTYWGDSKISRLRMSTFVPTANWLCFIKDSEDGAEASLYVYYLRTAFEDGYVDKGSNEPISGLGKVDGAIPKPRDADTRWSTLKEKVDEASKSHSTSKTLSSLLEEVYGYSADDESMPWYLKMTYEAVADLYSKTGKYYFSDDYVIRRFDITNMSISYTAGWDTTDADGTKNVELTANDSGAIYWVDGIGFVYNIPDVSEFNLKDYLSGKYPLPLAIDKSNKGNPIIVNYNLNHYGSTVGYSNSAISSSKYIPYGVSLSTDPNKPYIRIDGEQYDTDSVPKRGDLEENPNGSRPILPFVTRTDKPTEIIKPQRAYINDTDVDGINNATTYFVAAPTGVYNKFGGNLLETTTVGNLTKFMTDAAKIYYGTSQIKLNSSDSQSSTFLFDFVSKGYNTIGLPTTTEVYRVYRSNAGDVFVIEPDNINIEAGAGVSKVDVNDYYYTNPLEDWLKGLGTASLITKIDEGASLLIVLTFKVAPMIGVILMTILIGLSFIGDIKFVQLLFDKAIDPVRILTFGIKDIHTWRWQKVLLPCTLLFIVFAIFLNGNIIKIIMWGAKFYGVIMKFFKQL